MRWPAYFILLTALPLMFSIALRADEPAADIESLAGLLELVIDADADSARSCLQKMAERIRTSEVNEATIAALQKRLAETLSKLIASPDNPLHVDAVLLAALWRDEAAIAKVAAIAQSDQAGADQRNIALATLIHANDPSALKTAATILARRDAAVRPLQVGVLTALSRSENAAVASLVLESYPQFAADSQSAAIELLTQRAVWSKPLIQQIAAERIPKHALNINQVRKLLSHGDEEIKSSVAKLWGAIREGRDPAREQLVRQMRSLLANRPGDAQRGVAVFGKLCGQCHKIHGQGQEVGPDITLNGRASYEQLLSNVFDPSLVIGEAYQARIVRTDDGRTLTGLLAEDSEQRVVLKVQGGKLETVSRDEVVAMKVSELSLMPEGVEKQLQPQEIADLFAFIVLDKHPDDQNARLIPGAQELGK